MSDAKAKTAVVTGSTRGIGYGIADSLMARGCNVVLSGPGQDSCDAAVEKLNAKHAGTAKALAVACDVTSETDVTALWDAAVEAFGGVDIWLNNAGMALTGPTLSDLPSDDFQTMLNINLLGAMNGCKTAFNGMKENGGAIYNMLGAGWDGNPVPGMIGYATSKAGLTFMTKSFVAEADGSKVLVNSFAPGVVITEGFMREQERSGGKIPAARAAVLNIIGDHVETIADWVADTMLQNEAHGELFNWLTPERIAERRAMEPARNILAAYDLTITD
ncbi:SDR family NAD(P)-dependent oxidoreductase [Ponticaulis sp.]|uniref:SDR family NAD(P)-dependent oxidoreductase n=1 Tax=Ponticaulis sp. TaxID=2020902 RepID=UPI0025E26CA1|nr:SDR family oxidoreductase [Ponticaulis sp.]